jgi:restriction system protein
MLGGRMPPAPPAKFLRRPTPRRVLLLLGCVLVTASALTLSAGERGTPDDAAASATTTGGAKRHWRATARNVGLVAGGVVALLFAIRVLERKLNQQESEWLHPEDDGWDIGDEYPYCTEPPATESFTWDLREPVDLTVALLRQLEWKRFEELVCAYYEAVGFAPQPTRTGGRGGVDINLYEPDRHRPKAYVQCKAWVEPEAALKLLRALSAAMAADGVLSGEFVTAGSFPDGVRAWAKERSITMIDGTEFVAKFLTLPIEQRDRILRHVTRDDFRTPTCPNCEVRMVLQTADTGSFWRCPNFPRCQRQITMRTG